MSKFPVTINIVLKPSQYLLLKSAHNLSYFKDAISYKYKEHDKFGDWFEIKAISGTTAFQLGRFLAR